MKYLSSIFNYIVVASLLVVGISCSDSNPLSSNNDENTDLGLSSSSNNSVTLSMLAPVNSTTTQAKTAGGANTLAVNGVTISEAKFLIRDLQLESTGNDSLDFEVSNLVVDLPLDGSPFILSNRSVPVGTYDELEVEVHKPNENDAISDTAFIDGSNRYSMIIRGTKDGADFTLKSDEDFDFELNFIPPLEITDSTASVEIDLMVRVEKWFKSGVNGRTLDPTNPDDISIIENNIERSFETRRNIFNRRDNFRGDDDENEFEQLIKEVDLAANTFTIAGGTVIQLTDSTRVDQRGDFLTLQEVARALNNNWPVKAEGRVERAPANSAADFIAKSVKFETRGNFGDDRGSERGKFKQPVESVNLQDSTFITRSGLIIKVNSGTVISPGGDLLSLTEVSDALNQNLLVKAEGLLTRATTDETIDFIALRIEFEVENDADDDGRDDDEFEQKVESVDLNNQTFITSRGSIVQVTDSTLISQRGDLFSLQEVSDALANNLIVEVEGRVRPASSTTNADLVAIALKFETEREDDEDDEGNRRDEFESSVTSVNVQERTFTIRNNRVIQVTENTVISRRGDLFTLQEVSKALANSISVEVEGRGRPAPNNSDVDFIARVLKFETDIDDDDDDEEDENEEEEEDDDDEDEEEGEDESDDDE